jgi:hypothetical protein
VKTHSDLSSWYSLKYYEYRGIAAEFYPSNFSSKVHCSDALLLNTLKNELFLIRFYPFLSKSIFLEFDGL